MADTDDKTPQDWEDTTATLRDLFSKKAPVPDAAPAEAAEPDLTAFDAGEQPLPVLDEDALPAELPAALQGDPPAAVSAPVLDGPTAETAAGGDEEPEPALVSPPLSVAGSAAGAETQADTTPVPTEPATPVPTPSPSPTPVGFSNDLEEEIYAPSAPASGPAVGDEVDGYHLNEDLGRGWFIASPLASGPSVEVYTRPDPLWARTQPHRALPRFSQVGALHVLEPVGGEPLRPPLDAGAALGYVTDLARLVFALEKQGLAVVDLDPDAPRVTPQGLRLRFPPRVARVGDVPEVAVREGVTPPEVLAGRPVDARSGVYLLGALLYGWLTGRTLPPEGASDAVLGGLPVAGVPQLLRGMLGPPLERLEPAEVLAALRTLALPALPAYHVAAATSVGLNPERPMNEDSYGFTWRQLGVHGASTVVLRACVADGMGGMAAGEVASAAAVQAFLHSERAALPEMVWDANAAVLAAMAGRDGGCTFSGVEVRGPQLQLGHVGDTRTYVRQGGAVRQLSRDHSYVAAMVASGQMTPEEAQTSPERNKVLRSLGSLRVPQDNYVQTLDAPLNLAPGDRVLLVSDGVWGEVPDAELMPLLDTLPVQELVDGLIERALAAGAPDNATALVVERVR